MSKSHDDRFDLIDINPSDIKLEPWFNKNDKIGLGCLCVSSAREGGDEILDITPAMLAPKLALKPDVPETDNIVSGIFHGLEKQSYLRIEIKTKSDLKRTRYDITLLPKAKVIRAELKRNDNYTI